MQFTTKTYGICVLFLMIPMLFIMGLQTVKIGILQGAMPLSSALLNLGIAVVGMVVVLMLLVFLIKTRGPSK